MLDNEHRGRNGLQTDNGHYASQLSPIEDYLVLLPTEDDAAVLMRCTDEVIITADTWAKPGIERDLPGRKIILVLPAQELPGQTTMIDRFRQSKAQTVRVWRIGGRFGEEGAETLRAWASDHNLPLILGLDKPWLAPLAGDTSQPVAAALHRKLSQVTPMKVNWIYENRIAPGFVSLFAGRTSLGKSFVTCDIVARLSRGEPAPYSKIQQPPMRTLFISEDSPEYVLAPRLLELKADPEMVDFMTWDAMSTYTLSNVELLERVYQESGRPGLIVIDPPANFLGSVDEHKNAEVRVVLKALIGWLELRRVAAILITHINKQIGKGMDAIERIMGSVAWGTSARITCAFTKDPDMTGQFLFGGTKNNLGEPAETLMYKIVKTETFATIDWQGPTDTTMDDAINQVTKKSRGKCAVEWLEARFRERDEWESDELKRMAMEAGISKNALWSPEVNALPIEKKKRINAMGDSSWVWRALAGWPHEKNAGKVGNVGKVETQDVDWYEDRTFPAY